MTQRKLLIVVSMLIGAVLLSGLVNAGEPVKPKPGDKCPVCGMFVSPYPQWTAEIVFKDGTYAVFDGPKDMFKYYFNIRKYNNKKSAGDISRIFVTEYYSTKMMDAKDVYFIQGSDVMGPMGHEFVPVRGKSRAETFMGDHGGKKMLQFGDVTGADIP